MKAKVGLKSLLAMFLLMFFPMSFSGRVSGQAAPNSGVTQEMRVEANKLFQAQDWEKAAQAYEKIVGLEPQNANALNRLGNAYHSMKKYDRAASILEKATTVNPGNPFAWYNLACSRTRLGDKEKALDALDKAVAGGYNNSQTIKTDEDLAALRGLPRFNELMEKADRLARPCEYDAKYKQFDFWVGEWDVRGQTGQQAGVNIIQRLENGCIILENWTDVLGNTGKSINFFNPVTGKWRQTWVAAGGIGEFEGEFKDGVMRFEGESHQVGVGSQKSKLTFFVLDDGRIRQLGESTSDGGKTWTTTYDFFYTRRNASTSPKAEK